MFKCFTSMKELIAVQTPHVNTPTIINIFLE